MPIVMYNDGTMEVKRNPQAEVGVVNPPQDVGIINPRGRPRKKSMEEVRRAGIPMESEPEGMTYQEQEAIKKELSGKRSLGWQSRESYRKLVSAFIAYLNDCAMYGDWDEVGVTLRELRKLAIANRKIGWLKHQFAPAFREHESEVRGVKDQYGIRNPRTSYHSLVQAVREFVVDYEATGLGDEIVPHLHNALIDVFGPQYFHDFVWTEVDQNPPASEYGTNHTIMDESTGIKFDVKVANVGKDEEVKPMQVDSKGLPVKQISYMKATNEPLLPGETGKKYINANGEEVQSSELRYVQTLEDGTLKEVFKFEQTKTLNIEKRLPRASLDSFLIVKQVIILPKTDADLYAMWVFAESLWKTGQIAATTIVQKAGWNSYGMLLIPFVSDGKFSLIGSFVEARIGTGDLAIPAGPPVAAPAKKKATVKSKSEGLF